MGRNENQKNKWTPHNQTEFDGEPEKITLLRPGQRTFIFDQIPFLKKTTLNKKSIIGDHFCEVTNGHDGHVSESKETL